MIPNCAVGARCVSPRQQWHQSACCFSELVPPVSFGWIVFFRYLLYNLFTRQDHQKKAWTGLFHRKLPQMQLWKWIRRIL